MFSGLRNIIPRRSTDRQPDLAAQRAQDRLERQQRQPMYIPSQQDPNYVRHDSASPPHRSEITRPPAPSQTGRTIRQAANRSIGSNSYSRDAEGSDEDDMVATESMLVDPQYAQGKLSLYCCPIDLSGSIDRLATNSSMQDRSLAYGLPLVELLDLHLLYLLRHVPFLLYHLKHVLSLPSLHTLSLNSLVRPNSPLLSLDRLL